MPSEPVNIFEYEELAKQRIEKGHYDFIAGGATDEITIRRTRAVFDSIMMRPRMMVDISQRDLSITVLGQKINLPIMLDPAGNHSAAHPDAEIASVKAAGAAGTLMVLSSHASRTLEDVAAAASGPLWFQQYFFKHRVLDQILNLDPQIDHARIVHLDACYEFPFDFTRADEFALYRTYAVPSIGNLLHRTGEFIERTQRRYDDTKLIISELVEHGYDSERGQRAMRQMNHQHGRFDISNSDLLYVLSTFVFEPPRWMARFARRPMLEREKLALFYFWRAVGQRMHIQVIPEDMSEFERFNVEYEQQNFRYTEGGHRVASATRDMFLGWVLPPPLRRFGAPAIHALLDDHLLESLGFPSPSPTLRSLVQKSLRSRSKLTALLPERRKPFMHTARRHRSYPSGYQIERLGPPGSG